jgi:hypothetical protein
MNNKIIENIILNDPEIGIYYKENYSKIKTFNKYSKPVDKDYLLSILEVRYDINSSRGDEILGAAKLLNKLNSIEDGKINIWEFITKTGRVDIYLNLSCEVVYGCIFFQKDKVVLSKKKG